MCWSATADLVSGSVITAIGVGTLARLRRPQDLAMAALPLVLGAHQLIESVVWRSRTGSVAPAVSDAATTLWAIIAYPLLPLLIPVAVLLAAAPGDRRRLAGCVAVGCATSAVLAHAIAANPVAAYAQGHTLRYDVHVPAGALVFAAYLAATVGALLLSRDRDLRLLGFVAGGAAAVCLVLWETAFASTWCAWAAVVSLIILRWVRRPPGPDSAPHTAGFTPMA